MLTLDMKTPNFTDENIAKIAEIFPNCVTEIQDEKGNLIRGIDFDLLRQELSANIVEGQKERYQINWPGKREALIKANEPINKTLRPCHEESVNFDTTQNLYIEGDNLEALKLLQESYLGKVKMIYIDPPYNTGNDFVYNDSFIAEIEIYNEQSGYVDDLGNQLIAEEQYKKNQQSNGRFHSDWLSMIFPRLKLARQLLKTDGIIFISIDDNEIHNLRKVCDEVFGEENFVDNMIWKKRYGGGAKEKHLVSLHEYVLVYAKNKEALNEIFIPLDQESITRYYKLKDSNFSTRGPYRTHPLEAGKAVDARPNLVFDIPAPDGTMITPKRQWYWSQERVEAAIKNGELEFVKGKDGDWTVHSKQYLRDENGIQRQGKAFSIIDNVYSQHGTNEILDIFGNAKIFSYPKPSQLIYQLLSIGLDTKSDDIILDFFSGSAATAHALMELNAEDGGSRKFIMVQLPEELDEKSEAYKAGYKTIPDIGKERIRRAGQKILEENKNKEGIENLDIGFRVLKIDSSNMKDIYYSPDQINQSLLSGLVDHIKEDRTPEDLLFQVLLDWGVDLMLPIVREEILGKTVFFVDGDTLAACFDDGIDEAFVKELAKREAMRVVFKETGFARDDIKDNVEQIFKELSPDTEVRAI